MDYIEQVLVTWSSANSKFMAGEGVLIHNESPKANDILYVPQNWIMVEQAVQGHNLIYGGRKSMLLKSPTAASNYGSCLALFRASKRIVIMMEAISAAIKL